MIIKCDYCNNDYDVIFLKILQNGAKSYLMTDGRQFIGKKCINCRNRFQKIKRKETNNESVLKYEKFSKKGFLVRVYRNMLSRVRGVNKNKAHLYIGKNILDKDIFYKWSIESDDFNRLYDEYVKNLFDRKMAPSIDRIDSNMGYMLDNMRWVTFSENCRNVNRKK